MKTRFKKKSMPKIRLLVEISGRYKQLFALITPFETLIGSDRNLYNPGLIILQGFVWSH